METASAEAGAALAGAGWTCQLARTRASSSFYARKVADAGGLGGFLPPIVMATVKAATGSYAIGFYSSPRRRSFAWSSSR